MEEKEIIERYTAIQQAMIDKDIRTLDSLILDGTSFRHMSGVVQSKAEYFHDIETGRLDYQGFKISDPKVSIDGDNAVLKAKVVLTANAYGAQGSWPFNVSVHFVRIGGNWYMTN